MPELTRTRQYVELPQKFTGSSVITQYVPGYVFDARLVVPLLGGVADHDDIADDDRRRRRGDVAPFQVDTFVGVIGVSEVGQQIDDTGVWKTSNGHPFAEAL